MNIILFLVGTTLLYMSLVADSRGKEDVKDFTECVGFAFLGFAVVLTLIDIFSNSASYMAVDVLICNL